VADAGIKKVVIPKSSLTDVTSENKYLVRYRIVSDDKNRVSSWSSVFSLNAKPPQTVDAEYSINGRVVTLVWGDEESRPQYDIFVKFDSESYFYHGTSSVHTYTFINNAEDSFRFAIQVSGIAKTRSEALEIYESGVIPLV
jgi:hypothetical protein